MKTLHYFLYEGFETLDIMGPIEMLGTHNDDGDPSHESGQYFDMHYVSADGGPVASYQGFAVQTEATADAPAPDIIVIPGGRSSEDVAAQPGFMEKLTPLIEHAEYCLTICTGSLMLARTGLIDGLPATTNKLVFDLVTGNYPNVDWQKNARWVRNGKYYTSSGVSAGTDMALAFIADQYGEDRANHVARVTEYVWNKNPEDDPFAIE